MPCVLVRLISDQSIVGLFDVATLDALADRVDHFETPSETEFLVVGDIAAGGPEASATRDDLDPDTVWQPTDPMCAHRGSQLDALLSSPQGRHEISRRFRHAFARADTRMDQG